MKKLLRLFIAPLFIALLCSSCDEMWVEPVSPVQDQQKEYVGLASERFNYVASSQEQSQWCWAASIQMVLNYYGIAIQQSEIVARTYGTDYFGNLPNWSGSFEVITANLNYTGQDDSGQAYQVQSVVYYGAPDAQTLIEELSQQHPVIVGYQTGSSTGHAVVVTAVSYTETDSGPAIQSVVVRDPWPSAQNSQTYGRQEYPAPAFMRAVQAHWYVRVN